MPYMQLLEEESKFHGYQFKFEKIMNLKEREKDEVFPFIMNQLKGLKMQQKIYFGL